MRVDQFRQPEVAEIMCVGVEKLMVRGVSRRTAVRCIARKHGVNARSVSVLIATDNGVREVRL